MWCDQDGTVATWLDPTTGARTTFRLQLRGGHHASGDAVPLEPEQLGLLKRETTVELADAQPMQVGLVSSLGASAYVCKWHERNI